MTRDQLNQLYRYAVSLTNKVDEAFDLVQSALEKCYKQKRQEVMSVAYVRAVIRNHFIDLCRRKKIIAFDIFDENTTPYIVDDDLESVVVDQSVISHILTQLSNNERELLFLWAVEEYTAQEIADELNSPRNTILSRLHRVKQKAKRIANELDNLYSTEEI